MGCKNKTDQPTSRPADQPTDIIAIDGPAGSGKSTVAKEVARRLGFLYIDTGAMYRALTLKAIKAGINLEEEPALVQLAQTTDIELKPEQAGLKVFLDQVDVSRLIRDHSITEQVRFIARVQGVRAEMLKLQRKLGSQAQGAVLEGRDIGTVVFPQAKYKFYLDAQVAERVQRRYKELIQMGQKLKIEAVAEDLTRRDKSDMERDVAPLVKAPDAIVIDTTNLSVQQVADKIVTRCSIG